MLKSLLFVFWFFLPVGLSNIAAFLSSKIPLVKKFNFPLDFYLKFRNKRVFGDHKTIRGIIFGTLISIAIVYLQIYLYNHLLIIHPCHSSNLSSRPTPLSVGSGGISYHSAILWNKIPRLRCAPLGMTDEINYNSINPLIFGTLAGFGALIGDAIKSFFKRQLQIPPGKSWIPFDQIDYILGGAFFTAFYIRLTLQQYLLAFLLFFLLHFIFNYLGYFLKLRKGKL